MPKSKSSSQPPDPHLWVTILAGGAGTRFWPLSTPGRPKQLLPLAGPDPLILETMDRARGLVPEARIRILTGEHLRSAFQAGPLSEFPAALYLIEPKAKGTGPVLAWAAWALSREDPDAVIVSLHADHAIEPTEAFLDLLREGAKLAVATGDLFTVAVPPTRPETGYGYIRPGEEIPWEGEAEPFRVEAFVEKPDAATAEAYLREGYLWNSGIFLWTAAAFLTEVRDVAPEVGEHLPLLDEGKVEEFFDRTPTISVDEAVLERSPRVSSLRATFQWDDVGSWEALSRTIPGDEKGNHGKGDIHSLESSGNIAFAEEGSIVLFGVQGLVVVRCGDAVLVAERSRTPELKRLVRTLPAELTDPTDR